jgi:hypothetical protein
MLALYIYMYICICVYVYIHVGVYRFKCLFQWLCMCIYIHIYIYTPSVCWIYELQASLQTQRWSVNILAHSRRHVKLSLMLLPLSHCMFTSNRAVAGLRIAAHDLCVVVRHPSCVCYAVRCKCVVACLCQRLRPDFTPPVNSGHCDP